MVISSCLSGWECWDCGGVDAALILILGAIPHADGCPGSGAFTLFDFVAPQRSRRYIMRSSQTNIFFVNISLPFGDKLVAAKNAHGHPDTGRSRKWYNTHGISEKEFFIR